MRLFLALALTAIAAISGADLKEWQARYDRIVAAMKKRDAKPFLEYLHKDYVELADGLVMSVADVRRALPARMDTVARYGQKPKVLEAKVIGSTARITFTMTYRGSQKEGKKTSVYETTATLLDTWLQVGTRWQLYRSTVMSSVTKRNGKVVKKPGS